MPNNYFKFKQFTIHQDRCAMKVGTDGVLLGAWTDVKGATKVLDVGSGTGLLALMLAQRSEAIIDAVEIDSMAASQAKENVSVSSWSSKIKVFEESFQSFLNRRNNYDLIVSNPPYFTDSLHTPDYNRTIARHNYQLSPEVLINGVLQLLEPIGRFSIILPEAEYSIFRDLALESKFYENRRTLVYPSPDKKVKRVLAEYSFFQKGIEENSLIIEKYGRHKYSEEFIELTRDYYLKL